MEKEAGNAPRIARRNPRRRLPRRRQHINHVRRSQRLPDVAELDNGRNNILSIVSLAERVDRQLLIGAEGIDLIGRYETGAVHGGLVVQNLS